MAESFNDTIWPDVDDLGAEWGSELRDRVLSWPPDPWARLFTQIRGELAGWPPG